MRAAICTFVIAALATVLAAAPAGAATGSPPLSVPSARLAASLACHGDLAHATTEPVLLVPGTTLTPKEDFSWNYERAFTAQKRPWCAVTLPGSGMGDIQIAGEYVVHAIRTMYHRSGRKVEVVGHSQGGMVPRWALKYWPDTRAMVDDLVGLAPSNHGTVDAVGLCLPAVGCAPSFWQQRTGSDFLTALNKGGETWRGISYTDAYTRLDEVVVPNFSEKGSSSLHTGSGMISNIAVQSICPGHVADHLTVGTSDPVGYAIVMDAITHPGPARASRIDRAVCHRLVQPGVNPVKFAVQFAQMTSYVAVTLATYPHVRSEPPLASYAR